MSDELRHGWRVVPNVECVECPSCGFEMGADHTDDVPDGGYSCPNCDITLRHLRALELERALTSAREVLRVIVKYHGHSHYTGCEVWAWDGACNCGMADAKKLLTPEQQSVE